MGDFISLPGLQFYILQLDGRLTYEFALGGKPAKSSKLCHGDFGGMVTKERDDFTRSPAGTDASAVGLKIKLVRNDGVLSIDYQDEDGSIAKWTFEGLQEMGDKLAVYAWAGTQTCITTFVIKGVKTVRNPMIDEKCEAFIRSKGAEITLSSCTSSDGSAWNVSAGGVAKRLRRGLSGKSFV